MKNILSFIAAFLIGTGVGFAAMRPLQHRFHIDSQYAVGEWNIEVQTPPCDGYKNIQVIYPKESGAPITIECDLMPVKTK